MPDVNVLLYAHRRDEAMHEPYRLWLEDVVDGPGPFLLSTLVAVAFVRIATNRRVYPQPSTPVEAWAAIGALVGRSTCRVVGPGARHLELTERLCRATGATGKLVADAAHAAVAIEHGATWVSRDGDFRVFEHHGLDFAHLALG